MTGFVAGFITCRDLDEAKKIARTLLEKRLVSCCNIVPKIESLYWWKGRIEEGSESLIMLKTREGREAEITSDVRRLHSYELPDIHFIGIGPGYGDLAGWIERETGGKDESQERG